jgi:NAD+ kinase
LTNRPIVVGSESVVGVSFSPSRKFGARLVCDNVHTPDVKITDIIEIRKEEQPFRLLHPLSYDFFEILRAKLNWSSGHGI